MRSRALVSLLLAAGLLIPAAGCSVTGAAMQAVNIGKNVSKKDSYLRIFVDGHEATQNQLKKAYMGHASFKVRETVGTRPTFKFDFIEGKNFGRITSTSMQIHKEFDADYSHQAEWVITPANSSDTERLMKPGVEYNLASPGPDWKVYNFEKQEVSGIELQPGLEYLLVFTVAGDRSETVQVLFSTK